jgi:hypothetical protein
MEIKQIKHLQVTINDVKNIKKFQQISDTEANKIVSNINDIALLIYHQLKKKPNQIMEFEYLQAA